MFEMESYYASRQNSRAQATYFLAPSGCFWVGTTAAFGVDMVFNPTHVYGQNRTNARRIM
jgi:hypothetical protein